MSKRMRNMLIATGVVLGLIFGFKAFGNFMMHQAFDSMALPPATISAAEAKAETWADIIEAVGTLAAVQGTQSSLRALDRELKRMLEEEELAVMMLLIND